MMILLVSVKVARTLGFHFHLAWFYFSSLHRVNIFCKTGMDSFVIYVP